MNPSPNLMKLSFQVFCVFALAMLPTVFAAPSGVSGKWTWIYERNGEPLNIEMNVKQEGSKVSGKILAPENRIAELRDGKISEEGKLTFYVEYQRDSGPLRIDFSGKADG